MSPRMQRPGAAPLRRFFLAARPAHRRAELDPEETQHALRVLRVRPGDRLLGLDGEGGEWLVEVERADRESVVLAIVGEPEFEAEPGAAGAPLPWIEVATALPRGERAEQMIDRLVQLGVARFVPLVTERATPQARSENERRRERLARIAREACKQSGRLWPLEIADAIDFGEWLGAVQFAGCVRLDPRAEQRMSDWARGFAHGPEGWSATREKPLVILVGPEGGFSDAERALCAEKGLATARLGPHILRVECAAEAAASIVAMVLFQRPSETT